MATPSNRARHARSNHIFLRHIGAETKDVYFRVNPQAIRVQQGNKGSVVDTLGGYFREVMFSEDPQHNGLLLPDLTIECETGAGYRKELERLEWVWRNHGTPKDDGTPADTYLMDMADEDTLFFDGAIAPPAVDGLAQQLPQGVDPTPPLPPGVSQDLISKVLNIKKTSKNPIAKTLGGTRFTPRAFKIEILNFSWDETVQDPYRIRFNFRCKVLRDMFWVLDGKQFREGDPRGAAIDLGEITPNTSASIPIGNAQIAKDALKKSSDFPLNIGAHAAMLSRTLDLLPGGIGGQASAIVSQATPIINQVLQAAGLGQNQPLLAVQNQGQSVYDPVRGQRLYWRSEFSGTAQNQETTQQVTDLLDQLPGLVQSPLVQTGLQVAGWSPAVVAPASSVVSALSLLNL